MTAKVITTIMALATAPSTFFPVNGATMWSKMGNYHISTKRTLCDFYQSIFRSIYPAISFGSTHHKKFLYFLFFLDMTSEIINRLTNGIKIVHGVRFLYASHVNHSANMLYKKWKFILKLTVKSRFLFRIILQIQRHSMCTACDTS